MGVRTHLTLKKPQRQIYIKEIEKEVNTYICYLENYCIGKSYFNELPYINDQEIELESLWYREYEDRGEIQVKDLLKLLNTIQPIKLEQNHKKTDFSTNWLLTDYTHLHTKIKTLLEAQLIEEEDYVQFEVW